MKRASHSMRSSFHPTSMPLVYLQREVQHADERPIWTNWCDLSWFEIITLGITFAFISAFLLVSIWG